MHKKAIQYKRSFIGKYKIKIIKNVDIYLCHPYNKDIKINGSELIHMKMYRMSYRNGVWMDTEAFETLEELYNKYGTYLTGLSIETAKRELSKSDLVKSYNRFFAVIETLNYFLCRNGSRGKYKILFQKIEGNLVEAFATEEEAKRYIERIEREKKNKKKAV